MNPLNQLTISVRQNDEFYSIDRRIIIAKLHTQYRYKKRFLREKKSELKLK